MCRKTSLKISRAETEFVKFRFNKRIERNRSDDSVRLRGRLVNKVERFEYFESIAQENEAIAELVGLDMTE